MSTVGVIAGSVEYVSYPVAVDGGATNPTGDTVEVAVRAVRDTTALTWHGAADGVEWVTDTSTDPDMYSVRFLVGTAPFALAAGLFAVYIRVTDTPETPILSAGQLYVAAG